MSAGPARQPQPPELPGYRYLHHIGSGGNAEVYLYEQERPKREVAVKVLNEARLTDAGARQFTAEANAMAGLADHPNIASVFTADIAPDGRPYLVMQYYSQPNLGVRARRGQFAISEVLKIGVQIAGAVETSHRGGILHRDIKPHNILTGKFGTPALTDFGIATAKGAGGAEGMSVPWSPPEVLFGTSDGDERADVYSLGATLWHLLAGRSPFEEPGGDNTAFGLMRRIQADGPPRTGRADVPDSLERLLRQTLAKNPDVRPQRALDLARGLQAIEQELHLPHTQVVVPDDHPSSAGGPGSHTPGHGFTTPPGNGARPGDSTMARPGGARQRSSDWDPGPVPSGMAPPGGWPPRSRDDDVTRQRNPRRVTPWEEGAPGPLPSSSRERVLPPLPSEPVTTIRRGDAPLLGGTPDPGFIAGRRPGPGPGDAARLGSRRRLGLVAGGVLVAAVAAGGAVVALNGGPGGGGQPQAPATTSLGNGGNQNPIGAAAIGAPEVTTSRSGGKVHFSWKYANPGAGDFFQWRIVGATAAKSAHSTSISVPVPAGGRQLCIQVRAVRQDSSAESQFTTSCG